MTTPPRPQPTPVLNAPPPGCQQPKSGLRGRGGRGGGRSRLRRPRSGAAPTVGATKGSDVEAATPLSTCWSQPSGGYRGTAGVVGGGQGGGGRPGHLPVHRRRRRRREGAVVGAAHPQVVGGGHGLRPPHWRAAPGHSIDATTRGTRIFRRISARLGPLGPKPQLESHSRIDTRPLPCHRRSIFLARARSSRLFAFRFATCDFAARKKPLPFRSQESQGKAPARVCNALDMPLYFYQEQSQKLFKIL